MNEPLARELRPAVEAIDFITNVMEENDEDSTIEDEWKYIALIIGRVLEFFIHFFLIQTKNLERSTFTLHLLLFRLLWNLLFLLEHRLCWYLGESSHFCHRNSRLLNFRHCKRAQPEMNGSIATKNLAIIPILVLVHLE